MKKKTQLATIMSLTIVYINLKKPSQIPEKPCFNNIQIHTAISSVLSIFLFVVFIILMNTIFFKY